jgi:uncharacterized protein YeaO (DUF488 family)
MGIRIKRIYDALSDDDGRRILVDRLWPRGISKDKARLHAWIRDIAPSNELRKWYGHDPARWAEFKQRYFSELDANPTAVAELRASLDAPVVTFLFSSTELELNNAVALKHYLDERQEPSP